ncbi:hypothetical protein DITRI_Ditri08aG0146600 [Diplodiscus trichospermus]
MSLLLPFTSYHRQMMAYIPKKMSFRALLFFSLFLSSLVFGSTEQCGIQAGSVVSKRPMFGDSGGGGGSSDTSGRISDLISRETFEEMLLHRNNPACPAVSFYTYKAFIAAAKSFPDFALVGDNATRKREIAAFLGQTSHETTDGRGGWNPPDGPFAWGYCFNRPIEAFPCAPGQQHYGRGPIQLSWNYNYGQCRRALGLDLLNDPDLLLRNVTTFFESAF